MVSGSLATGVGFAAIGIVLTLIAASSFGLVIGSGVGLGLTLVNLSSEAAWSASRLARSSAVSCSFCLGAGCSSSTFFGFALIEEMLLARIYC